MKRSNSRDLTDRRAPKKEQIERATKSKRNSRKNENKHNSLPKPIGVELTACAEALDEKQTHQAAINHYKALYQQFYQEYRQAYEEDGFLPPVYFVALARCKSAIPTHLIKQKRSFNQLTQWAEALRAPLVLAAPVAPAVPENSSPDDEENEELIAMVLDGMNLNAD